MFFVVNWLEGINCVETILLLAAVVLKLTFLGWKFNPLFFLFYNEFILNFYLSWTSKTELGTWVVGEFVYLKDLQRVIFLQILLLD